MNYVFQNKLKTIEIKKKTKQNDLCTTIIGITIEHQYRKRINNLVCSGLFTSALLY